MSALEPTPAKRPGGADGAILIVDDSPLNLQAAAAALDDMAYEIVTVESGAKALRQLLDRDFAVVLLDVSMPNMDGYETARLIRSRDRNSHVPIIFVTAYDRNQRDVLRAYELGAVDFLFKPLEPAVLRSKVSVFVELQRRAAEVSAQAERLRELERREHQQALETQRRRLEAEAVARRMEEQRAVTRQLAELDRRKDQFLAMLGHELRTPLAAMVIGLEVASSATATDEQRARALAAFDHQLQHLVRLVDDLLDVARIRSGRIALRREVIRLDAVIERAIELARPAIDTAGHQLRVRGPDAFDEVEVDPARIVQVLSNLLHNAARYTEPRGTIELSVASAGDDRVCVSVQDDGCGIDPTHLESVFDIFVRDAHDGDGLGLGLALARTLAELHGGSLTAHSEGHGRGARFDLTLPLVRSDTRHLEASAPDLPAANAPVAEPAACRVLLVEDNADVRETLATLLDNWGHHVEVSANGRDGLNRLLTDRFDVALIDIGLPDLDGCDLVRRALADGARHTHLIALTGFTQPDDRRRITEAGFDELVAKPPDLRQLRRVLHQVDRNHS